jgi:hypothetical protein
MNGKCPIPPPCKPGYILKDGRCVPQSCPPHFHLEHGTCVLDPNCHYEHLGIGIFPRMIIVCRDHTGSRGSSTGESHYVGSSTSSGLTQIPSKVTDFPNNNPSVIQVHVTSAKKDVTGSYHIIGEITNNANSPIHSVMVTVHLYDANNGLVGVSTCCYTTPIIIDPGHTATFDSFVTSAQTNGKPVSYRLSYDWS